MLHKHALLAWHRMFWGVFLPLGEYTPRVGNEKKIANVRIQCGLTRLEHLQVILFHCGKLWSPSCANGTSHSRPVPPVTSTQKSKCSALCSAVQYIFSRTPCLFPTIQSWQYFFKNVFSSGFLGFRCVAPKTRDFAFRQTRNFKKERKWVNCKIRLVHCKSGNLSKANFLLKEYQEWNLFLREKNVSAVGNNRIQLTAQLEGKRP